MSIAEGFTADSTTIYASPTRFLRAPNGFGSDLGVTLHNPFTSLQNIVDPSYFKLVTNPPHIFGIGVVADPHSIGRFLASARAQLAQ